MQPVIAIPENVAFHGRLCNKNGTSLRNLPKLGARTWGRYPYEDKERARACRSRNLYRVGVAFSFFSLFRLDITPLDSLPFPCEDRSAHSRRSRGLPRSTVTTA